MTRALMAVARVRGVEERTSRIELEHALRQVKERERELRTREQLIRSATPFEAGSAAGFLYTRHALSHLARDAREAARQLDASTTTAAEAHQTWLARKARLRAVELLLERREERRREELVRRERAELDDIAGQAWLRGQGGR